jgi:uncharacterized protein YecE (DUF72 family)
MGIEHYYLGCPIWGSRAWVGELFTAGAKPSDFLRQYALVFNAVEGNTTFYGVPSGDVADRWRDDTPADFRFCFKFPRHISHEGRLVGVDKETEQFLAVLAPLADRLGPSFLQLPPSFGPAELPQLVSYLERLPDRFPYAVEVRHAAFYSDVALAGELNDALRRRGVDRVIFDTRGLRAADPHLPGVAEAQRQKPYLPVQPIATGSRPFVRFHGHPLPQANVPLFQEWCDVLAGWIGEGRTPYFFLHALDDQHMPHLARAFHERLGRHLDVGPLPPWPAETDQPLPEPPSGQLSLFD